MCLHFWDSPLVSTAHRLYKVKFTKCNHKNYVPVLVDPALNVSVEGDDQKISLSWIQCQKSGQLYSVFLH